MAYNPDDKNTVIAKADHLFQMEDEILTKKAELLHLLVESEMLEFFSINWGKLRRATGRHPHPRNY